MARRVRNTRWMWGRWVAGAVVLVTTAAMALPTAGQVPHRKRKEQFKAQVEQLEQAWRTAQLNDDVVEMDKLLADDYVGITMSGQVVTKMQQLDRMRNRSLLLTKIDLDDVKVKLIGSTAAVVTSLVNVDGTNEGVEMHGMYRYTRVYTRLPTGMWKITNFEATRVGTPGGQGGPGQPQGSGRHHRGGAEADPARPE